MLLPLPGEDEKPGLNTPLMHLQVEVSEKINTVKKKILMLIPNLDFGGAQRVFHDHAKVLSEKYEVIECVFNLNHGHAYPTGNRVISLDVYAGTNIIDKVWQFIRRCRRLNRIKNKEKPSMTISHLEGADYVNLLSFGRGKKVLVVHGSKIHDRDIDSSFGWVRKNLSISFLYRFAHRIITVSEGIKHELIHNFGLSEKKITTIYNFFSLNDLQEKAIHGADINLPFQKQAYRLITSGRLANQKNQIPLLYILKHLKDKGLDVQLYFVGDGPLKQDIVIKSQNLGLSIKKNDDLQQAEDYDVILLGYQDNPFKYYGSMDLFVFPSAWEGFPMALGEAMVLGMPVISSDCPTGPLELLLPDWREEPPLQNYPRYCPSGILLPIPETQKTESIILWADTIMNVLQDERLKREMGKSAKKRMELLDYGVMKDKWLEI